MAPLVATIAVCWLVGLLVAPFLPAPLAAALYAVGSLVCHQLPERSFHVGGFQLPVCARCVGIYAGAACGAIIAAASSRRGSSHVRLSAKASRWLVALAALPTVISVALEASGLWRTTNEIRFTAGFPLGLASAFVVVGVLATLHYNGCVPRRPTVPSPPPHI
jgi:uncharacterized membrane protein